MKHQKGILLLMICLLGLTGCEKKEQDAVSKYLTVDVYAPVKHAEYVVKRENLKDEKEIWVKYKAEKRDVYKFAFDGLPILSFNVSEGQKVEKGDVLITLDCHELEDSMQEKKNEIASLETDLEHNEKMSKLAANKEEKEQYAESAKEIRSDLKIQRDYLAAMYEQYQKKSIVAKESGFVEYVADPNLKTTKIGEKAVVITCGKSLFLADAADLPNVKQGDTATIAINGENYSAKIKEIKVIKDSEMNGESNLSEDDTETDDSGKKYVIYVLDDNKTIFKEQTRGSIKMNCEEEKNVLYVPNKCLVEIDDGDYVYRIDDAGFLVPQKVEAGKHIGQNTVILNGLKEGDVICND